MTQAEFAQELGISKRSYINRIDNESDWCLKELIKISQMCDDEIKIKSGVNTYSVKVKKV